MNYYYPHDQLSLLLAMLFTGLIIGVLYDSFKIKQMLLGSALFFKFADDLLFSIISVIIFIMSVFAFNNGIVRWYSAVFCVLGFAVYRITLSKLLLAVMMFAVGIIRTTVGVVLKILFYPLHKAFALLLKPRAYIFRVVYKYRLECEFSKLARIR